MGGPTPGCVVSRNASGRFLASYSARNLAPILRDEIYRIISEAVRNAFQHAAATRIEVEIQYTDRELRLRVRDEGKGIDPGIVEEGGRAGHYRMAGMRERAKVECNGLDEAFNRSIRW